MFFSGSSLLGGPIRGQPNRRGSSSVLVVRVPSGGGLAIFRLVSVRSCFCYFRVFTPFWFQEAFFLDYFFAKPQDFACDLPYPFACYKQVLLFTVCFRVYLIARTLFRFENDRLSKVV